MADHPNSLDWDISRLVFWNCSIFQASCVPRCLVIWSAQQWESERLTCRISILALSSKVQGGRHDCTREIIIPFPLWIISKDILDFRRRTDARKWAFRNNKTTENVTFFKVKFKLSIPFIFIRLYTGTVQCMQHFSITLIRYLLPVWWILTWIQ